MNKPDIAKLIDHSLLRPDATTDQIQKLCDEAMQYGFFSVCVNPFYIPAVRGMLRGSAVKVSSVIGFPFGMTATQVKVFEAIEASLAGADEIDIVMNIGEARSGHWDTVRKDISDVIFATRGVIRKIIIETCYLTTHEKRKASEVILDAGAEFIKTSTGFGAGGAESEDISLIKAVVGNRCGIKAAGGIKTLSQVKRLIDAGATRIGTSHGVKIVTMDEG
ncbi:MAG TPA: deoxyribose-phosphate aldolase [Nitrospiraceae bacterium]|jgi:deoxyribose-phosphate aldolase|nr:deoxyribose-phosphate aldolase [Nitrospiraceae bacterium]